MSGTGIDRGQAAALLQWWRDAGVDVAVRGNAPSWLDLDSMPERAPPASAPQPLATPAPRPAMPARQASAPAAPPPRPLPDTFDALEPWLAERSERRGARHVAATGGMGASLMLMGDRPDRDDVAADAPFGGLNGELAEAMARAMGVAPDALRRTLLEPGHLPGERPADFDRLGAIARAQVRLAKPQRLVLFGDACARALLGKPLAQARAHLHEIEGVPTVATLHPRWLLQRPQDKRLAWDDLLLLMETA